MLRNRQTDIKKDLKKEYFKTEFYQAVGMRRICGKLFQNRKKSQNFGTINRKTETYGKASEIDSHFCHIGTNSAK